MDANCGNLAVALGVAFATASPLLAQPSSTFDAGIGVQVVDNAYGGDHPQPLSVSGWVTAGSGTLRMHLSYWRNESRSPDSSYFPIAVRDVFDVAASWRLRPVSRVAPHLLAGLGFSQYNSLCNPDGSGGSRAAEWWKCAPEKRGIEFWLVGAGFDVAVNARTFVRLQLRGYIGYGEDNIGTALVGAGVRF